MNDLTQTIDLYLAAWNEPDIAKRAQLIARAWSKEGRQIDPPLAAEGHEAISNMVSALQTQFPGHHFRRASGIDAHHGHFRVAWDLVGPNGAIALSGLDTGELADDGRLLRITGFFGPLPALEKA